MINILLTNDDGVDSPGLGILAGSLAPLAKVWVCAPKTQQSGTGHGITVRDTILVREERIEGAIKAWSVEGKPADCVKIALLTLLPEAADIVISGINDGANLGTDTMYSGTVAGAMEGAISGLPAIALSLDEGDKGRRDKDFRRAAGIGVTLLKAWADHRLKVLPGRVLNVNVPASRAEEIRGYKAAGLGSPQYSDEYVLHEETGGYRRYQLTGERLPSREEDPSLDAVALAQGYVTMTPLSVHMTDHVLLRELEEALPGAGL
ncbi:MAG: 5'/3'-nucleotidase SurE [Clostridiales bacterium]|nr:5'/3'-nucleotidase SurE [Clostridiales bacterium]